MNMRHWRARAAAAAALVRRRAKAADSAACDLGQLRRSEFFFWGTHNSVYFFLTVCFCQFDTAVVLVSPALLSSRDANDTRTAPRHRDPDPRPRYFVRLMPLISSVKTIANNLCASSFQFRPSIAISIVSGFLCHGLGFRRAHAHAGALFGGDGAIMNRKCD
jgi:hypothetical protein